MKQTTSGPKSRTRTRRRVVAACVAVVLLVGLGVRLWQARRVPPPDADAGRLSRYMAGPAFAALSDARKAPYLDAFQRASDRGELTAEQQRGVIRNVTNPGGKNPIQQYFSLPGAERVKFLDDVIDRVLKAEKEAKRPPPPDEQGGREMRFDGGRLADTIPPEDRARMGQFLQDLHDRRVARGVPDDGKFLFNRPD
jgi:hypothetical protein